MLVPTVVLELFIGSRKRQVNGIIKISLNTWKFPGDLRKLAITQIPNKDPRLNNVLKTHKEIVRNVENISKNHKVH